MRTIRVGTFYSPGDKLIASHIRAYTVYYDPEWEGCIVYDVEAESGKEAKAIAVQMRLRDEQAKAARKEF